MADSFARAGTTALAGYLLRGYFAERLEKLDCEIRGNGNALFTASIGGGSRAPIGCLHDRLGTGKASAGNCRG
jgi:hypothetical protein